VRALEVASGRIHRGTRAVQGVFGLNQLTTDYLMHQTRRADRQWRRRHRGLTELLEKMHFSAPRQQAMLQQARRECQGAGAIFSQIVNIHRRDRAGEDPQALKELESRLAYQLRSKTQRMVSTLFALNGRVQSGLGATMRAINLAVLLSTGVLVVAILVDFFLISRSILRPLARLREGARTIGSGNLEYRMEEDAGDEVGELSRALDRMAENLHETTASRDELAREVTQRRQAERRLQQTLTELRESNEQLQRFAFISAHHLREPLRKITSFGDRLSRRTAGDLSEANQRDLEYMCKAAMHMQNLVSDLRSYAQVVRRETRFTSTDLSTVTEKALAEVQAFRKEVDGTVEIRDLPTIDADPDRIQRLIRNLIENALKFHREDQPPAVTVEGRIEEKKPTPLCVVEVSDNGIGFKEKYKDRIFSIFGRLHPSGTFEGTGIGLAVCAKIVHQHGGTIDAHSSPGEGSRFIVQLPAQHSKEENSGKANHDSHS
jgi:signal transduction histidine kinase